MSWYDPRPVVSSDPLTAHEVLKAKHFVQRANVALAQAKTKEAKRALRDAKKTASFMGNWLTRYTGDPDTCRLIRSHLADLPTISVEVAA